MAVAYTTYKRNAKKAFQYQFTCEHCGKESPMKTFVVSASASKDVPGKAGLSPVDQAMLDEQAAGELQAAITIKKNFVEKGSYGQKISGKCDYCGKRQSWELKSAKLLPLWRALTGLAAGFLIMVFASLLGEDAGNAAVIFIPIGLGGGLLIGLIQLVNIRTCASKKQGNSKPSIYW